MTSPNIPGWARLEQCPKTPGCSARVVWRDADNKLWRLDTRIGEFTPHHCQVRGSDAPTIVYLGEWYNKETGRTRWIGPKRVRKSAEIAPADKSKNWKHISTKIGTITWEDAPDDK